MDNKDVTTFKDEHLPFAENILNELKPENISGVDYAISNDGDYYLGIDSIKNASDNNVKFDSGKIGLSPYAVSKDGKLYLGEDAIKNIPEDVVLKDVNINGCKNITEWNHKVEVVFLQETVV
ncbi:hypothetical protein [Komagataeibacter nataicola]|uniref:hypothetical protein n=1 Tax=Komagataeibacter nataicola TaxID=265960 RepID=UPI00125D5607|nr:hypothetical protein [Komagataeibacter nataicola]